VLATHEYGLNPLAVCARRTNGASEWANRSPGCQSRACQAQTQQTWSEAMRWTHVRARGGVELDARSARGGVGWNGCTFGAARGGVGWNGCAFGAARRGALDAHLIAGRN